MVKLEIEEDKVQVLTKIEVAEQMMNSRLSADEKMGDVRLEFGCELEVDVLVHDPSDLRRDGTLSHTETFSIYDIREEFCHCDSYVWGLDEHGEDVLIGIE